MPIWPSWHIVESKYSQIDYSARFARIARCEHMAMRAARSAHIADFMYIADPHIWFDCSCGPDLYVESEIHDIAILHNIILTF